MHRTIVLAIMLAAAVVGPALAGSKTITLYKSPTCGCCTEYARYLTGQGYDVAVVEREDMDGVKNGLGVPPSMRSCHTGMIDGYLVEGHVPVEAIERLLAERPKVKGVASPGMPTGSPGMPGPKEPNHIHTFGPDGSTPFMRF